MLLLSENDKRLVLLTAGGRGRAGNQDKQGRQVLTSVLQQLLSSPCPGHHGLTTLTPHEALAALADLKTAYLISSPSSTCTSLPPPPPLPGEILLGVCRAGQGEVSELSPGASLHLLSRVILLRPQGQTRLVSQDEPPSLLLHDENVTERVAVLDISLLHC